LFKPEPIRRRDVDELQRKRTSEVSPARGRAVYAISVAAELTGAGIQNLRVYERHGLVVPARTDGGTRRYSEEDLERVRRILQLLDSGLNLAGVARVLALEDDNAALRAELDERDERDERTARRARQRAQQDPRAG
jgi:DNA-binding transcriptional MerR regulator